MSLIKDRHTTVIDGHEVSVHGKTGKVHATWTLLVDGVEADGAAAAGDFTLRGMLPDGKPVEAAIHQSMLGPTSVTLSVEGEEVETTEGFVL